MLPTGRRAAVDLGGGLLIIAFFAPPPPIAIWNLKPRELEERRLLQTLPSAFFTVTEVTFPNAPPLPSVVCGKYVDAEGKRWNVKRLKVSHPVAVGDFVTILYDHEAKTSHALQHFTAFEPA